jgi:hypothetical protein
MVLRTDARKLGLLRAERTHKASLAHAQQASRRASAVLPIIEAVRATGVTSMRDVAAALNAQHIPTQSGRGRWHAASVLRVIAVARAPVG